MLALFIGGLMFFGEIWSNVDKEFVETIGSALLVLFLFTKWSGSGEKKCISSTSLCVIAVFFQ